LIFFLVFLFVSVLCFLLGGVAGLVIGILAILLIGAILGFFAYRHFRQTKLSKKVRISKSSKSPKTNPILIKTPFLVR